VSGSEPIEEFLDELLLELRGTPRAVRRALCEVEEHLREATREGVAAGLTETDSARRAIGRFGSPAETAALLGRASPSPPGALVREAVGALVPVGAAFLVAIGLSGLLADVLGRAFGKAFVAGDAPGVTYTAERCAQYLALEPHARTCQEAAILHHYGEVVDYRLAAGVLGVVLLAGWAVWRRGAPRRPLRPGTLGRSFPLTVGAALASAAAAALLFLGSAGVVTGHYDGTGNPLSGGLVSALLAAAFGTALWRELRRRRIAAP
jgi:HAAS